mgnify:CR=1 FL=1
MARVVADGESVDLNGLHHLPYLALVFIRVRSWLNRVGVAALGRACPENGQRQANATWRGTTNGHE